MTGTGLAPWAQLTIGIFAVLLAAGIVVLCAAAAGERNRDRYTPRHDAARGPAPRQLPPAPEVVAAVIDWRPLEHLEWSTNELAGTFGPTFAQRMARFDERLAALDTVVDFLVEFRQARVWGESPTVQLAFCAGGIR